MMVTRSQIIILTISLTSLLLVAVIPVQAQTSANFLYRLSDFNGPVESLWARVAVDKQRGEVYTLDRSDSLIEIYNQTAMQIFGFGEDLRLASASDIAAGDDGEIYILYRSPFAHVKHLDYRGLPLGEIRIERAGFQPDFLDYHAGKLYLADSGSMQVLVAAQNGAIEQSYDFRALINEQIKASTRNADLNKAQRKKIRDDRETLSRATFGGFGVGPQGNLYFTLGSLFTAYRYGSDGKLQAFGIPGSAPGKFGVAAGICADSQGNIYVSDRLRSVVLMFDGNFNFLSEFGYRGALPHNLVVPDDIAIDEQNQRIYVAQAANRGVSAFSLNLAAGGSDQTRKTVDTKSTHYGKEDKTPQTATVDM